MTIYIIYNISYSLIESVWDSLESAGEAINNLSKESGKSQYHWTVIERKLNKAHYE